MWMKPGNTVEKGKPSPLPHPPSTFHVNGDLVRWKQ